MRKTKALYGDEARSALMRGVDAVFNAVAPTMGAKGRNAVYKKYGMPIVTNDGISIAREIRPEDEFESLGAESIKQASEETNYQAGDGTSGTIVATKFMLDAGKIAIDNGVNPMVLRREMEVGKHKLLDALKAKAVPVDDRLKDVAMISVEDEEMATMVSELVGELGVDSSITVEESPGVSVRTEVSKGYTWNNGYVSPYMITNNRGEAILENCAVIITDKYMNLNTDLFQAMTELVQKQITNVLLVAENIEGELLQTIHANKQQGFINIVAVRKPETNEELEDLATITGATAVTSEKDIRKITAAHAGMAQRVVVTREKTIVMNNKLQNDVDARIEEVKTQIEAEDEEKYGNIEILRKRLSRLTGGVARIKVGAHTEAEQAYKKMKLEDAVGACRAALQEGIVPGGGTTLRDLVEVLEDDIPGEIVLRTAFIQPYRQILANSGVVVDEEAAMTNYNVLTGEIVDDMFAEGIVDPAKVVRCIIENAVSTAGTLLTTECAIADIPEDPIKVVQG